MLLHWTDTLSRSKPVLLVTKRIHKKYAKYYRNIGYNSKVVTYEELEEMQKKEAEERKCYYCQ